MNNNQPLGIETKNYIKPQTPKTQNPVFMISLGAAIGIAVMSIIIFLILPIMGLKIGHVHELADWRTITYATCSAEGEELGYCSCGFASVRNIPKLPHEFDEWSVTALSTCAKAGEETRVCACGAEEKRSISTLPHTFGEYNLFLSSTCYQDGEERAYCDCGAFDTKLLPFAEHALESIAHTPATCTETGLTEGKKCSVCNSVVVQQTAIPVIPHTEVIDTGYDATATSCGLTDGKHCSVCQTVIIAQEIILPPATETLQFELVNSRYYTVKGLSGTSVAGDCHP